jgi:hypothetical protein
MMIITRICLIIGILLAATVASLRVAGVIPLDIASDALGRSLSILAILGFSIGLIGLVAGPKGGSRDSGQDKRPGPKF